MLTILAQTAGGTYLGFNQEGSSGLPTGALTFLGIFVAMIAALFLGFSV